MGAPNLHQRLYLAKALNEETDHLFDHPDLNEQEFRKRLAGRTGINPKSKEGIRKMGKAIAKVTPSVKPRPATEYTPIREDSDDDISITEALSLKHEILEGSRGLARHERIVKALTKKSKSLYGDVKGLSPSDPEFSRRLGARENEPKRREREEKYFKLSRGQQARDRVQIARERTRAGLSPKIPASSVNATSIDATGTWRTKSEPVSQNPKTYKRGKPGTYGAPARVPKAVLKYRETSKAKKAAALAAKGKK